MPAREKPERRGEFHEVSVAAILVAFSLGASLRAHAATLVAVVTGHNAVPFVFAPLEIDQGQQKLAMRFDRSGLELRPVAISRGA